MTNPIARKIALFAPISDDDRSVLSRLTSQRVRHVSSHEDVIHEGERPRDINLFLSGWACRYKQLENGRRQILAFFLPGDICELNVFILREMDHSIGAITPVAVAQVSADEFEEITLKHPRVMQALWWESLVNSAVQREWTVNIGQRTAVQRLAHLICELFLRLRSVGLAQQGTCEWPITQVELADATGMTSVHVSRTLHELRKKDLVQIRERHLAVRDLSALMRLAMFNPNYLHLRREWTLEANVVEKRANNDVA
jgi:CRP-like cAMP-binding protein